MSEISPKLKHAVLKKVLKKVRKKAVQQKEYEERKTAETEMEQALSEL